MRTAILLTSLLAATTTACMTDDLEADPVNTPTVRSVTAERMPTGGLRIKATIDPDTIDGGVVLGSGGEVVGTFVKLEGTGAMTVELTPTELEPLQRGPANMLDNPELESESAERTRPIVGVANPGKPIVAIGQVGKPIIGMVDQRRPIIGVVAPGKPVLGTITPGKAIIAVSSPGRAVLGLTAEFWDEGGNAIQMPIANL